MKLIVIMALVVLMFFLPAFMGRWCRYNTELLVTHYFDKQIELPNWPFVIAAYITQSALAYGIITEIWCQIQEIK